MFVTVHENEVVFKGMGVAELMLWVEQARQLGKQHLLALMEQLNRQGIAVEQ